MTTIDLTTLHLEKGHHPSRAQGVCLLEAAAWQAGEPHTDHPECVSPILGQFGRSLNDVLPDDKRQQLVPLVPLLIGTAGDGHDEARGYMALDWIIRTYTPAWLDLASLSEEAAALRDFRRIADLAAAQAVRPHVLAGRDKAAAAGDAARAAARAAAWDAARAAAWDAARAAAGDAARDAARAAAGDAARAAAWDAAGDAAWDAAGAAAWAAAGAAAGDAAWDAARERLAPTVASLQDSAITLYRDMVNLERAA